MEPARFFGLEASAVLAAVLSLTPLAAGYLLPRAPSQRSPRPPFDTGEGALIGRGGAPSCPDCRAGAEETDLRREAERENMCKDLTVPELVHMFETLPFHEGWDYETRLRAVLSYFRTGGRVERAEGAEVALRDFALPGRVYLDSMGHRFGIPHVALAESSCP